MGRNTALSAAAHSRHLQRFTPETRQPGAGRWPHPRSAHLRLQEAALTGDSEALDKVVDVLDEIELPLGDRCNMAFMGMAVTYGCGQIVVTATGMHTQLGAIAALIQTIDAASSPAESSTAYRSHNL